MSPRELARWATSGPRRRRPVRGLIRDMAQLIGTARSRPSEVPGLPVGSVGSDAPVRPGSLRAYLAPVPVRVQVDGPNPALLPNGSVIMVANHPTAGAADLVLSRLAPDRRSRTVLVARPFERIRGITRLVRPVVRIDPDNPGAEDERLRRLLGQGWSTLIFPEGEPAAGATKRPYHPHAADLAAELGVPVIPVGIRGARAIGAYAGPARVSVRFGHALPAGVDIRAQEAAIEALIAEDRATWWAVQQADPGQLPSGRTPESARGWRHVWAQTAPPVKGGTRERPRIWR